MTDRPEGTVIATVAAVGLATVQDGGRFGWAGAGVPVSGAWHGGRYRAAAALIGGSDAVDGRTPAIEVIAGECVLELAADTVGAVVGPALLRIDGRRAPTGTVVAATAGSRWSVQPAGRGPVYVVLAGWRAERLLGSAATDTFSGLGTAVARGRVLAGVPDARHRDTTGTFLRSRAEDAGPGPLRVVATDAVLLEGLAEQSWSVATVARSGVRLMTTAPWSVDVDAAAMSRPLVPGTVQVTPSGEAIVLGPDGGLTGGYAVAGVVATVDVDHLSTLRPDDPVRLLPIGLAQAQAAFAAQRPTPVVRPDRLA